MLCPCEYGLYKDYCDASTKQKTVDTIKEDHRFDGISDDYLNMSYEDVDEKAPPTPVNFAACEKMELVVHFLNKRFDQDHIQSFVLDSPIEGWAVHFLADPFSLANFLCDDKETYGKMAIFCFTKLKECSKF